MLYTGSDFLADIGGYLGLFLGLSVFGVVEMVAKVFNCKCDKEEKEENVADETAKQSCKDSSKDTLLTGVEAKYRVDDEEKTQEI